MRQFKIRDCEKGLNVGKTSLLAFAIYALLVFVALPVKNAWAFACIPCTICTVPDTTAAETALNTNRSTNEPLIEEMIDDQFESFSEWTVEWIYEERFLTATSELVEFFANFGMYQTQIIGAFFDARVHLETQRLFFELQAQAHKDYQPSEDFCWFGTGVRSLSASEGLSNLNLLALSQRAIGRQLGVKHTAGASGVDMDQTSRWEQFTKTYCDNKDNNWTDAGTGLDLACDRDGVNNGSAAAGATDRNRVNIDIDYTRLIEEPRTLNANFSNEKISDPLAAPPIQNENEEDVMALAANLYGHDVLTRLPSYASLKQDDEEGQHEARALYFNLRSVVAKRNVAEHSFNSIVSMKTAGTGHSQLADPITESSTGSFLSAVIKDLMPSGTSDEDILKILGENPSYYAQLEVLGKKIYQNSDFFANLYDTPVNVERKHAAMKAIELMIDRALFESELRQEMMLSVMLANQLNGDFNSINKKLGAK